MTVKNLSSREAIQLFNSYNKSLESVLKTCETDEGRAFIKCLTDHANLALKTLKLQDSVQTAANKSSWMVMTALIGTPQLLPAFAFQTLQYDMEQDINSNIEQLYNNLPVYDKNALYNNLKEHEKRNIITKIVTAALTVSLLVFMELISPWSAWGVAFLFPLYSVLTPPLLILATVSLGIQLFSMLHESTLVNDIMAKNFLFLEESNDSVPADTTNRFFQPGDKRNPLLDEVERSFDKTACLQG